MKAVIVDLQGSYAAALCEDGSIRKIAAGSCVIGQMIDLGQINERTSGAAAAGRVKRRRRFSRLAAVAAACFLTISTGVVTAWAMPYGHVYLEEEDGTSVTYTINRFDYVLDVSAEGEDGEELLSGLTEKKIRHSRIDRAVSETLDQLAAPGHREAAAGTGNRTAGSTGTGEGAADVEAETVLEIGPGLIIRTDLQDRGHAEKLRARLETASESEAVPSEGDRFSSVKESKNPADSSAGRITGERTSDETEAGGESVEKAPEASGGGRETSQNLPADETDSGTDKGIPAADGAGSNLEKENQGNERYDEPDHRSEQSQSPAPDSPDANQETGKAGTAPADDREGTAPDNRAGDSAGPGQEGAGQRSPGGPGF